MQPRITNPAMSVPGVMDALQALGAAANRAATEAGVPEATINLVCRRYD